MDPYALLLAYTITFPTCFILSEYLRTEVFVSCDEYLLIPFLTASISLGISVNAIVLLASKDRYSKLVISLLLGCSAILGLKYMSSVAEFVVRSGPLCPEDWRIDMIGSLSVFDFYLSMIAVSVTFLAKVMGLC